jgi:Na+-transporting NADH:ubiquinone oxidoreductase subunit NqrD
MTAFFIDSKIGYHGLGIIVVSFSHSRQMLGWHHILIRDCVFQCLSDSSFTNKRPIVSFTDGNGKGKFYTITCHEGTEGEEGL